MKKICWSLVTSFLSLLCTAQTIKEINIGDSLPDVAISSFLNGPKAEVNLKDLSKGKLLIIDFWATWCSPCISSLIKWDKLKTEFQDKIQILATTYESREVIERFMKRRPEIHKLDLIFRTDDTLLIQYFPHRAVPHIVWVDSVGIVRAITSPSEVTNENVAKFIGNANALSLSVKKDDMRFNMSEIFRWDYPEPLTSRSLLMKKPRNIPASGSGLLPLNWPFQEDFKYERYIGYGMIPLDLFLTVAYKRRFPLANKHMYRVKVKNVAALLPPRMLDKNADSVVNQRWYNNNSWLYELIVPPANDSIFFRYMQDDLERALPYRLEHKIEKQKCYVLVNRTEESRRLTTSGAKRSFDQSPPGFLTYMRNEKISTLVMFINYFNLSYPLINETKNVGEVDMPLGFQVDGVPDIQQIRRALYKQGFDIILTERLLPMAYIVDK